MTALSYQLYCSRNFPPLDATLSMLAEVGFTQVEGFGGLYGDEDALAASLDKAGLKMTSGHFNLDMIENDPSRALAIAKRLGVSKIYVPFVMPNARPSDAAGWAAFGKRLGEAAKPIVDAGHTFGWHNHEFEMIDLGGGDRPLDLIAQGSDDITLELDLAWVKRGGQDPVAWIQKYAGRISAVHVKDIAPAGECKDEDGWADVGHGTMDWAAIIPALRAAGVDHWVAEHDNPKDDRRFATRSLASMKSF